MLRHHGAVPAGHFAAASAHPDLSRGIGIPGRAAAVGAAGGLAVVGGLAALGLPPLRTVLHGVVDELLFGARADPLEAATHVADHSAGDPVLALRAVRDALGLPYAALRVGDAVELLD